MRTVPLRLALPLALATLMVSGSAPVASAAETVHLYFRAQNGPIRMLGAGDPIPTESISFNIAVAGLAPDLTYRLVGSKRPCSKAHVASAKVFGISLGTAGADGAVLRLDQSTPLLFAADTVRSVRLFTRHADGVQKLCARAIPMEAGPLAAISFNFAQMAFGVHDGAIKGLTAFQFGSQGARVSSILIGLPVGSTSRLAAVDETCDSAIAGGDVVARERVSASAKGVIAVIDRPVDFASLGRENSIECTYIMKGASGLQARAKAPAFVFHTITWD